MDRNPTGRRIAAAAFVLGALMLTAGLPLAGVMLAVDMIVRAAGLGLIAWAVLVAPARYGL